MKFNFKKTSEMLAESGATDEQMDYETRETGIEDMVFSEETGDYDYPPGDLLLDTIHRQIADGTVGYPQQPATTYRRGFVGEVRCRTVSISTARGEFMRGDDVNKDDLKILDEIMGEREPRGPSTEAERARLLEMIAISKMDLTVEMDKLFGKATEDDACAATRKI